MKRTFNLVAPYNECTFNRTIIELKQTNSKGKTDYNDSFNRTIIELKRQTDAVLRLQQLAFNRTIIELKPAVDEGGIFAAGLLIGLS